MEMVTLTINGQTVQAPKNATILEAARSAGIYIPTLCYHPELAPEGACRLCVVEASGARSLVASCVYPVAEGMVVKTNTPKVRAARKMVVELLLANHPKDCLSCQKSGDCELQKIAADLGLRKIRFEGGARKAHTIDGSNPCLVRDQEKCILCGRCIRVCRDVQGMNVYSFANRGFDTIVSTAFEQDLGNVACSYCGQCASVCPTGAIVERDDTEKVWDAINDQDKIVIVQTAPSVRVAIGEELGMEPGSIVTGKMVAALRHLGFDKVFDTDFSADLTIMEESAEFLDRIEKGEKLPIAADGAYMNFSGVETKASRMAESEKCDKSALALGVLENVRDTLVKTINKAMTDTNTHRVLIVGGVASNGIIRNGLTKKLDGDVYFAKAEYSTDNAVGTAYLAHLAHKEA